MLAYLFTKWIMKKATVTEQIAYLKEYDMAMLENVKRIKNTEKQQRMADIYLDRHNSLILKYNLCDVMTIDEDWFFKEIVKYLPE